MDKVEAFQHDQKDCKGETEESAGWFYWSCPPGCLPEGDAIGPFSTEDEATEDALKYGYFEDETLYTHIIDLDERGCYRAHVEAWNGDVIFSYDNENPGEEGRLWIVEDGFMRNTNDMEGLTAYLIEQGVLSKGDRIEA